MTAALSQAKTFCPPGQQPHFSYGFAFLKSQLGEVMGEPLECEHFDAVGNAFQQTTTGRAFYNHNTNTPIFTIGNRNWAWTPAGLKQWVASLESPAGQAAVAGTIPEPIKVTSYNILFGAGVDPGWENAAAHLSPFAYPGKRLSQILAIIKAAEPDILGIQEAAGWDSASPAVAQQVADELGMDYFLAHVGNGLHLVLFTRYKIIETENLSDQMGNVGALRATLSTPDGQLINVFITHLDPFSAATRASELAFLTRKMSAYLQTPTILMGDMNFYCLDDPGNCQEYAVLSQAGWHLAQAGKYKIDQIWASPRLNQSVEMTFPGASFDISDHLPVGAIFEIPSVQ